VRRAMMAVVVASVLLCGGMTVVQTAESDSCHGFPEECVRLTLVGDFPDGYDHICSWFHEFYPALVGYLGEPMDPTYQSEGVTWIWDAEVELQEWFAESNSVEAGPQIRWLLDPPHWSEQPRWWWLYQQYAHETAHLFYDVGDSAIGLEPLLGQWLWEAHANVGTNQVYVDWYGEDVLGARLQLYDIVANLGWDRVNGVQNDGDKFDPDYLGRNIVDSSGTLALQLLNEVLSFDSDLNYIRRVNEALLARCTLSGNALVAPEDYARILNEVAGGRSVDGMSPGDWLFSQPVSNIAGAPGAYLVVRPFHSHAGNPNGKLDMSPTAFEVGAFVRTRVSPNAAPSESPIPRVDIALSIADTSGAVIYETTVRTNGAGFADVPFGDVRRTLNRGAHLISVRCVFEGRAVQTTNLFVVMHNGDPCWDCGVPPEQWNNDYLLSWEDSRMFVVPMSDDGTELRPDLVERLTVAGGVATEFLPGILVIEAEPGAAVELSVGDFSAVVSKPISSRVFPLRVP